jgi:hypothetical protein
MRFKIHPAIGIARVGDSPDGFYFAPEQAGQIPNELNAEGKEQPVTQYKDGQGRIKRQAARFRVYGYDDDSGQGKEIQAGHQIKIVNWKSGQSLVGEVKDILWTVYLANKKASWYEFQQLDGEHGYGSDHPLRNADVTDADARQQLIIDPGPQTVSYTDKKQRVAHFAKGQNPGYTQSFPPPLHPNSIETLGELRAIKQEKHLRLLVLGGYGNSGSYKKGFGQPVIQHYANNDGWFDDVSDGPVTASVQVKVISVDDRTDDPGVGALRNIDVEVPAWCIVGYPRYAPMITDIVTIDEVAYDVAVRHFGYDTYMFGTPPFSGQKPPDPSDAKALDLWRKSAQWNPDYYPYFYRDIWPILTRPQNYGNVLDFDTFAGGDPHDTSSGIEGNFSEALLSAPPYDGEDPDERAQRRTWRERIWWALRKPGQENIFKYPPDPSIPNYSLTLMPFLCGDNPISNNLPSKFLRLTDTQLFILGQWAEGKFINEKKEGIDTTPPEQSPSTGAAVTGTDLDRGVLSNGLGGSFCPGGEVSWIIRNPAVYAEPFRIKHSPYFSNKVLNSWEPNPLSLPGAPATPDAQGSLQVGLEPGDLTKYSAVPWQSDFNECSNQQTDITYALWNVTDPQSVGDPAAQVFQTTYWWPSHRPMEVFLDSSGDQGSWSQGIPQTNAGDLKMVTAWKELGFLQANPTYTPTNGQPQYIQVERNDDQI